MKTLAALIALGCVGLMADMPGETRCHSEIFVKARYKLDRMQLSESQRAAIATYKNEFNRQWHRTHRSKGCSHHEAHAKEFVAAAAGVLTDTQFQKFQNRKRSEVESLRHDIWTTGSYLDDLIKIAAR